MDEAFCLCLHEPWVAMIELAKHLYVSTVSISKWASKYEFIVCVRKVGDTDSEASKGMFVVCICHDRTSKLVCTHTAHHYNRPVPSQTEMMRVPGHR